MPFLQSDHGLPGGPPILRQLEDMLRPVLRTERPARKPKTKQN